MLTRSSANVNGCDRKRAPKADATNRERWRERARVQNVPFPLVTSALHTSPRRAAARGLAAATRWVRELRRETFALRQVTEEVTADILLSV